jgi:serine/threonine protein kinase
MAIGNRKRVAVGNAEDYEETCSLGTGSYGSVAKARRRATGEFVAIKRVGAPGHCQGLSEAVAREAGFLESCRGNPFVVGYHGLVRAPGSMELRIVMEHVGPSLRNVFNRRGDDDNPRPLPEATVRAAMWQLLTGAEKMHALRIVHRDIKPENILVSADQSVVKMCDFGMALDMSDDDAPAQQYGRAGTRWYMAPEMLLGKTDYDARVDTWSLGCIMAELIGGDVLFQGASTEDQVCSIIEVLGVPGDRAWPWFSSTPFATRLLPRLPYVQRGKLLRKRFPETRLSKQGFQVLSGLLTWNPDKRLTASAALKHRWFACLNAPAPAMTRKTDLAPALPKMMEPLIDPLNLHKRQKRQRV